MRVMLAASHSLGELNSENEDDDSSDSAEAIEAIDGMLRITGATTGAGSLTAASLSICADAVSEVHG